MPEPTDDMIVLAAVLAGRDWRYAEDVASVLRRLGFEISTQKMVGTLLRLSREDQPMFEVRTTGDLQYRVTNYGLTQLANRYPHSRPPVREVRERRKRASGEMVEA